MIAPATPTVDIVVAGTATWGSAHEGLASIGRGGLGRSPWRGGVCTRSCGPIAQREEQMGSGRGSESDALEDEALWRVGEARLLGRHISRDC